MVTNWAERKEHTRPQEGGLVLGVGNLALRWTAGPAMTQEFQVQLQEVDQRTSTPKLAGSRENWAWCRVLS